MCVTLITPLSRPFRRLRPDSVSFISMGKVDVFADDDRFFRSVVYEVNTGDIVHDPHIYWILSFSDTDLMFLCISNTLLSYLVTEISSKESKNKRSTEENKVNDNYDNILVTCIKLKCTVLLFRPYCFHSSTLF